MFLFFGRSAANQQSLGERFQHSKDTISHYINEVLEHVMKPAFIAPLIRLPTPGSALPSHIIHNPKF
ncbi:hypothetical protein PsYK624_169000 [Phanerochaete sordida]|uniref:DUF8040 domain-containing protein n=1 Tax=Phanerochaete sordida TaxID=48140 RepID=A0A9P3GT93_9APHY|nr:hypothetical protein PsYK624_169000 [Phanerochaete sordida]